MDIEEEITCPSCKKKYSIILDKFGYEMWKYKNWKVQDAFPGYSDTDRESLISGLCPECQKQVFREESGFEYNGHWITDPHWDPTHRWTFDTEHDACLFYGFPDDFHKLWDMTGSPEKRMYHVMLNCFYKDDNPDDCYDVDIFRHDICDSLFTETDPQDIDEDDYLAFQMALIMLIRDVNVAGYYGIKGLAILHAELMHDGENYYVNKTCWKED